MIIFTDEQNRCIDFIRKWFRTIDEKWTFKLDGPAGSGKSTIAFSAVENLGVDPNSDDVAVLTLTWKAALVLRRKGLKNASSIHSALYLPTENVSEALEELRNQLIVLKAEHNKVDDHAKLAHRLQITETENKIKNLSAGKDELVFVLNPATRLKQCKLILVDESSFVGGEQRRDLEALGVPIIWLGDSFQLPMMDKSDDGVFFSKEGRTLPVDFRLIDIHRQAEGSAILRYSRDLRLNNRENLRFEGKVTGEDGGVLMRVPYNRLRPEVMARADQIICGKNDTRHGINADVREFLKRESPYPCKSDKLICLSNNKELNLFNGLIATMDSDYYDYDGRRNCFSLDITTEDGIQREGINALVTYFQYPGDKDMLNTVPWHLRKKLAHFDYGYAITCHKSQGSQYTNGLVVNEPLGDSAEMKRRWEYTAITRFEKNAVIAF